MPTLCASMTPMKFDPSKDIEAPEIAIIAFWKMGKSKELGCYRYFTVPNPIKHEIRKSADSSLT